MNIISKLFGKKQTAEEVRRLSNKQVIKQLKKHGDKLTKGRLVSHWIYFKTESDRELFLAKIKNDNFIIVSENYDDSWGEFSFSLHIERLDKVDSKSVDNYVIYLWRLANECNGDYDGWETSIETED